MGRALRVNPSRSTMSVHHEGHEAIALPCDGLKMLQRPSYLLLVTTRALPECHEASYPKGEEEDKGQIQA
jgi:hypothetical protein